MSAHRTRGILRAAALLAVGASPLMAGAGSATAQPSDLAEGKLGEAPATNLDITQQVTDLLEAQSVKLPATLPIALPEASAALGTAPQLPTGTPVGAAQERSLDGVKLPSTPSAITPPEIKLPNVQQPELPDVPELPDLGKPPVDAPEVG
ncbi:hypothetical protein [Saccharothrix sp.]|uniref:hypothetical protein n=1 Tax=Saccharothrix sp. TaxID=1873460 RepID=UPI0028112BEE|nr:hypothetical protein [Saccharothrix sp.]